MHISCIVYHLAATGMHDYGCADQVAVTQRQLCCSIIRNNQGLNPSEAVSAYTFTLQSVEERPDGQAIINSQTAASTLAGD